MVRPVWAAIGVCIGLSSVRADSPQTLGIQAKAVLNAHCAGCHGGGKANKGGFGFVLDRDRLVHRQLVVPGKAGQSDLLRASKKARCRRVRMPLGLRRPKSKLCKPGSTPERLRSKSRSLLSAS